jgi:hypothetical protein
LNVLSAWVLPISQPTLSYRVRGMMDTFNFGDQNDWIQIKGLLPLLGQCPGKSIFTLAMEPLGKHDALLDAKSEFDTHFTECLENLSTRYNALLDVLQEIKNLQRLAESYAFRDEATVRSFLHDHPQVIEVLLEAYTRLQGYFGPDLRVTLEVVRDPEVEDLGELFAYIATSLPVCDALTQLNRFDGNWFLDQLDRVDGLLNFNLEFV